MRRLALALPLVAFAAVAAAAPKPREPEKSAEKAPEKPAAPPPQAAAAPPAAPAPAAAPAAAAGPRAEKIKVAVLDLAANGTTPELASSLTSVVATELERLEVFSIISRQEIRAMLSHEAERQALGCDAGSSCLAEVGGSLGVRYLVSGAVGKIGETYTLNLALSDVEKATVEGRVTENVKEQGRLLDVASRSSQVLVAKILSDRQATLIVTCAEKGATVKIDGQVVGVTPLPRRRIGWGPHLLEVEKQGFITALEDFTVQTKGVVERSVTLIPSPDFLASYEGGASKMRLGAWLTTAAAAAALGAGGYFQFAHLRTATTFDDQRRTYDALATKTPDDWNKLKATYDSAQAQVQNARIAAGLGLAFAVGATYFWIAGEDPDRYARYRELAKADGPAGDDRLASRLSFDLLGSGGLVSASLALP